MEEKIIAVMQANGGKVTHRLPDHHAFLEMFDIDSSQQNIFFTTFDGLRKRGRITQKTLLVEPRQTYDAGRKEVNVRERIFTLVPDKAPDQSE